MLNRLTGFIGLYGAGTSAAVFALMVFVVSTLADLGIHVLLDLPPAPIKGVLLTASVAAAVSFVVILPFCKAALQLNVQEQELRRMRGDLRATEARFRDFAEAASDWYWETDKDLRFTYLSSRLADVTGLSEKAYLGKTRDEVADENTRTPKWQAHLDDLHARRPFKDFRYSRTAADGRVLHFSVSGRPVYGPAGNFVGYRGVATDRTLEVESEARAREARDLLATAVEGLSELFALWDKDDRLVVANERFRDMNRAVIETTRPGTRFEDHIRAALAAGLYPEAVGREKAWLADRLARHADPGGPFELQRQDGQWLLIREQRLAGGASVTVSTNITEIKKAEASLRASEKRLRDFASVAADWFWEQDADLRFTYVSVENEDISGIRSSDHLGKTRRETNLEEVSEEAIAAHEADCRAHRPFSDFRFARTRPDGSKVYLSVSGIPLFDDAGRFVGYRGVGHDITHLVEAEREVHEAREKAEAASRAKSDFLARMSHDLRAPLNAIMGFAEIIEQHLATRAADAKFASYARDIRSSGMLLQELISDILDLSKIEAGKYELHEENVSLAALIVEMRTLFGGQADRGKVTLDLNADTELPLVRADERALRQALMNLVGNAVKFTEPGGRVTVAAHREPDGLHVTVADTGIGFDMAKLPTVLEPFGRVVDDRRHQREGAGLGLAIVSTLMQMHGGRLAMESAPGQGTRASLILPNERIVADDKGGPRRAAE